jgi:hypothetical protein
MNSSSQKLQELESELNIDIQKALKKYQVLILPSTAANHPSIAGSVDELKLVDNDDSIYLSKLFKSEGVACANSYDLSLDAQVLHLRGESLQLSHIIITVIILPIFVNIVSSFITDKLKDNNPEKSNVTSKITIMDNKVVVNEIDYSGTIKDYLQLLENLKKNEKGKHK